MGRLIDADALERDMQNEWEQNEISNGEWIRFREILNDVPTIDPAKWIPVSERLPKEGVQVLVTDDAGGLATIDVDYGYFDEEYGRFDWFHSQNVTAWMPLPEPYRKDGD